MRLFKGIKDVTAENDIKYRGPFSYRDLRIIGWVAMAIVQVAMVILFSMKSHIRWGVDCDVAAMTTASDILENIGQLSVPIMLVANFGPILNSKSGIKKIIRNNAIFAIGFYLLFILVYFRYLLGSTEHIFGGIGREVVKEVTVIFFSRYLTFNCFIDMLVISSLYFFIVYRPTKHFAGKKLIYFRLLAIIPFAYEVACHVIKGLALGQELFEIPLAVLPLLTNKPVMTFAAFVVIVAFLKAREAVFVYKEGGTHEQYEAFLETNTNSFQFSVVIAISFLLGGLIDLAMTSGLMGIYFGVGLSSFGRELLWNSAYAYANAWGFGKAISLIIGAPIILLFSYTKSHPERTKVNDVIIPIAGFALCAFVWVEGVYDTLMSLPIKPAQNETSASL
ncbi:MAG: hypothetical protein MJ239_07640, partial [Bacilli bacterium]|nr:hypothetical protein [Bacilli bacterium]